MVKVVLQGLLVAVLLNLGVARAYALTISEPLGVSVTEGAQSSVSKTYTITNDTSGETVPAPFDITSITATFSPFGGDTANDLISSAGMVPPGACLGFLAPQASCTVTAQFNLSSGVGDMDVDTGLWVVNIAVNGITDPLSGSQILICDNPTCSVAATTPLPAALPLFATGLGALGLLGWRRKRKAQAI